MLWKHEPQASVSTAFSSSNCFSINLLVVQNFHLNPLHGHFENTKKRPPEPAATLITIYHRI